jgi:hypothetical protein
MIKNNFHPVFEKNYNLQELQTMAKNKESMPDGSYPIKDSTDLTKAIETYNGSESIKNHIISRARSLDLVSLLPTDWNVQKSLWAGSFSANGVFRKI